MIIRTFHLDIREETGELVLILDRDYPSSYSDTDQFTLEKYELDLSEEWVRAEIREAIKGQTVLQFMNDELMMSSAFWLPALSNYDNLTVIQRAANLRMTPTFVDISDFIKTQNTRYIDTHSRPGFLYLYRIVYNFSGTVYHTPYIAGFERIESSRFTSENAGRRLYKPYVSNDTLERLFGAESAPHIRKYFDTELLEKRIKYRQDPKVWRFPSHRVNFRFKGPNERYKLVVAFREAGRTRGTISTILDRIIEETLRNRNLMTRLSARSRALYSTTEANLLAMDEIASGIAGSDYIGLVRKTQNERRILSFDSFDTTSMIPEGMESDGLYVILKTASYAQAIYNALKAASFDTAETIYILVAGETTPAFSVEIVYE